MLFHRARLKINDKDDVVLQNNVIYHTTSTKCIGVIIDSKLKWNEHIFFY